MYDKDVYMPSLWYPPEKRVKTTPNGDEAVIIIDKMAQIMANALYSIKDKK